VRLSIIHVVAEVVALAVADTVKATEAALAEVAEMGRSLLAVATVADMDIATNGHKTNGDYR
jgi:hypothetical protein